MSTNRASLITKTHKVLKKHYQAATPPSDRTLFENLMYACVLEDSSVQSADDAFAKVQELLFDWNEIRVTTISELAEIMSGLTNPESASKRLRGVLHSVFETFYSFDLETFKKENIGAAVKKLEKLDSITPFCVSYVIQNSLGGHSIGVSRGVLQTLYIVGIISENEAKKRQAPGLERAIPKTKGVEFASLLHQLGADLVKSPQSTRVKNILLEIAKDAKDRLPKRASTKKAAAKPAPKAAAAKPAKKKAKKAEAKPVAKKAPAKKKKATAKTAKKKTATPKPKKKAKAKAKTVKKKSTTKRLSKKKPR